MTFSGLPNPQPSEVHREIGNARGEEAARNAEQARELHQDRPSLLTRLLALFRRS